MVKEVQRIRILGCKTPNEYDGALSGRETKKRLVINKVVIVKK